MEDKKKVDSKLPAVERISTLQSWYAAMAPTEKGNGWDTRSQARREFCEHVLDRAEELFKSFDGDPGWKDIIKRKVYGLKSSFRQDVYIC